MHVSYSCSNFTEDFRSNHKAEWVRDHWNNFLQKISVLVKMRKNNGNLMSGALDGYETHDGINLFECLSTKMCKKCDTICTYSYQLFTSWTLPHMYFICPTVSRTAFVGDSRTGLFDWFLDPRSFTRCEVAVLGQHDFCLHWHRTTQGYIFKKSTSNSCVGDTMRGGHF